MGNTDQDTMGFKDRQVYFFKKKLNRFILKIFAAKWLCSHIKSCDNFCSLFCMCCKNSRSIGRKKKKKKAEKCTVNHRKQQKNDGTQNTPVGITVFQSGQIWQETIPWTGPIKNRQVHVAQAYSAILEKSSSKVGSPWLLGSDNM